jgi:hypothetical protein
MHTFPHKTYLGSYMIPWEAQNFHSSPRPSNGLFQSEKILLELEQSTNWNLEFIQKTNENKEGRVESGKDDSSSEAYLQGLKTRVHSQDSSIRYHWGTFWKWFDQIPAHESPRRTGLHWSISAKSSFYLPAFEISRSCRTASVEALI